MNVNSYRTMTWALWLALPLTALRYRMVWDRLPVRMATHFDAAGHANGWMSREASLGVALLILTVVLAISTVVLRQVKNVDAGAWALWGLMAVVAGVLYGAQEYTIRYNLTGEALSFKPVIFVSVAGTVLLLAVYILAHRGKALSEVNAGDVIAEEVHSGRLWTPLFVLPLVIVFATLGAASRPHVPRIAVGILCLVMATVFAFAWDGFHYRVTRHGLEIRTLGFRLRSIPAVEIGSYQVERWNWLRGYGIRGLGTDRAYVWGNRVVHIKTTNGDVYLGHSAPEKLMSDLDRMRSLNPLTPVAAGGRLWRS